MTAMTAAKRRDLKSPAQSKVLIAGTARDCARTLLSTYDALSSATEGFAATQFFFVESDSSDGTLSLLASGARDQRWRYVSLGNLDDTIPSRTDRLALCRNRIVETVRNDYPDVDYIVLADLDGVNAAITRESLESAWQRDAEWDVVTANQAGPYYDIWALRHSAWCPGDCWEQVAALTPIFGREKARNLAIYSKQAQIPAYAAMFEVESAFGGLAIYRRDAFIAGRYHGTSAGGVPVCEHVPFHRDLRERGYRIFINPALLNAGQNEHNTPSIRTRLGDLLSSATRRLRVSSMAR